MKFRGFTMIELLVVIGIIAILAAILFPAAINAKDAAFRSSDMSHMNELRSALQIYRIDQGGYPPQLFGYVEDYAAPPAAPNTPIPADQIQTYLFPKRVSSISTFTPSYDRSKTTDIVGGANSDMTDTDTQVINTTCKPSVGSPPSTCVFWPGTPPVSPACNTQAYGNTQPVFVDPTGQTLKSPVAQYYEVDGYDVAPELDSSGKTRFTIHYALFWTGYGIGTSACTSAFAAPAGNSGDDARQLGYSNPPDNTVVTWDTYFRNYVNNQPEKIRRDVVLFIGGNAKMYDSNAVAQFNWSLSP